ncbi:MAG: GFA family protein [Pseudomonadales bacterium]|nr:GFA family protein [Pseudomonadales bacterium]
MKRTGNCSCGNVAFSIEGDPINTVFCYCKACQVASGSDKFYGVWLKPEQFSVIKGTLKSYTRIGDSGGELTYKFCENCGTKVCGESSYGIVTVAGATLDNTDGIEPQMAIFTKSAPKWAVLPKDMPLYETMPD